MSEQTAGGRRRAAAHAARVADRPADGSELAGLWSAVAKAQTVVDRKRRRGEALAVDEMLSDALGILTTLHERDPLTHGETEDLRYVLGLYADGADVLGEDPDLVEAAQAAVDLIRSRPSTEPQRPAPRGGHVAADFAVLLDTPPVDPIAQMREWLDEEPETGASPKPAWGRTAALAAAIAAVLALVGIALSVWGG